MQRLERAKYFFAGAQQAAIAVCVVILLSGCGITRLFSSPEPPPPPIDPETQSSAILTCQQIAVERSGIAQSLQRLAAQPTPPADEIARLNRIDGRLAQLAASKRCPAPIPPQ
ncbi:MAG TPA: hypothetical protein VET85_00095 [Stellaceae bacterium]|nr:hypothetical protein [Stellaceae bacterium]